MDKLVGMSLVGLALFIFVYYTVWVVVLPFVGRSHVLYSYFPPQELAVILPVVAALILVFGVGTFVAVVTWKNRKPAKKAD